MDNVIQLKKVFSSYPECIKNHKLFNALLLDFFYEDKVTRNIYKFISQEGILNDIVCSKEVSNIDVERYCLILRDTYGIEKDKVKPCISDLVSALDKMPASDRKPRNAKETQIGNYRGVCADTDRGLIETEDSIYYILPLSANKKNQFKKGESLYFMAESKGNMKFATLVSKSGDISETINYPLLNKKWEGVISSIDNDSLVGTLYCSPLEEKFDMFISGRVRKQGLAAGETVHFEIDVVGNRVLATEIERVI